MDGGTVAAIVSGVGTLLGTFGGIIFSARLTNYRLEQLEEKVKVHNNLVDRMYKVEQRTELIDEKIKVANHRIEDLEGKK
jgi:Na+/glutamate symporter